MESKGEAGSSGVHFNAQHFFFGCFFSTARVPNAHKYIFFQALEKGWETGVSSASLSTGLSLAKC